MTYHRALLVPMTCLTCGADYEVPRYEAKQRNSRYCSWKCVIGRPARASDTISDRVRRLLPEGGRTIAEVARLVGTSRQLVEQVAAREGIRLPTIGDLHAEKVRAIFQQGGGLAEVQAALGCSKQTATKLLKRIGWVAPKRPPPRFCAKGHDTWEVGRYKSNNNHCRRCTLIGSEAWKRKALQDPEKAARLREAQRQATARYQAKKRAAEPVALPVTADEARAA